MMNAHAPGLTDSDGAFAFAIERSLDGFTALQPEWDRLYEDAGRANPFLGYSWTRACFDMECGDAEPFILTLRRGGRLVGVAALCIARRFGFRVVRFIGEGRSDYLGFLAEGGSESVERRLMSKLMDCAKVWDLIVLRNLAEPFTSLLRVEKPRSGKWHEARWITSAYCRWDGDWDSLHEGGPIWLKQMRNRRRRFLKGGRRTERFSGAEAAERLDIVAAIEARSWKGQQGVARLQPGPGQEILRQAFLTLGSEIELWLAWADDQPIAFQIDFVTPERLWLYQYSYDELYSNLRAGSVIGYTSIEQAWEKGVREYDFLIGDESYKASRTTALRPISYLAGHPRTLRGWLAYATLVAPRWKLRSIPQLKAISDASKQMLRTIRARGTRLNPPN